MADVHYTDPSRQSRLPDIDEEQPVSTAEYVQNLQPIKDRKRKNKRNALIGLTLLLLGVVGFGVYQFVLNKPLEKSTPASEQPATQTQAAEPSDTVETYTSEELGISFEHLSTWVIDDTTEGLVTISSPLVKLTGSDGQEVDGKVVVSFMGAGSEVPVYENTQGLAALLDSEKITYDEPTPNQREQTYISFGGLTPAGINAVFVTGNSGYKKGQMIPEADVKKVEPIISVMFYQCPDTVCDPADGASELAIEVESWAENQATVAALALLKSLKVT